MRDAPTLYLFWAMTKIRPWGLALLFLAFTPQVSLASSGLATFNKSEFVIETRAGIRHDFTVEMATTPKQQAQGLMFRRDMAADAGMLFIYRPVRVVSMWMRNTVIPLDMLFIGEDGRIEKIVERTVPMSLSTITSDRPVRAVLELNSGTAARLGVEPGDRVLHEAFKNGS